MKITTLIAAAVISLASVAAHAEGEGNGEPFPLRVPGTASAFAPVPGTGAFAAMPALPSPAEREIAQVHARGAHQHL